MKESFYEQGFIRTVLVIIFLSAAMFFFGYLFGSMSAEVSKEYDEPVSAVIDGEEMPVVSVKTHGNYAEIVTDDNEKIYTRNLTVYESEKYYNGEE